MGDRDRYQSDRWSSSERPRDREYPSSRDRHSLSDRDRFDSAYRRDSIRDRDPRDREREPDRESDRDRGRIPSTGNAAGPKSEIPRYSGGIVTSPSIMSSSKFPGPTKDLGPRRDSSLSIPPKGLAGSFQALGNAIAEQSVAKFQRDALKKHAKAREALFDKTKDNPYFPSVPEIQRQHIQAGKQQMGQVDDLMIKGQRHQNEIIETIVRQIREEMPRAETSKTENFATFEARLAAMEKKLEGKFSADLEKQRKAHSTDLEKFQATFDKKLSDQQSAHQSELAKYYKLEQKMDEKMQRQQKAHQDQLQTYQGQLQTCKNQLLSQERELAKLKEDTDKLKRGSSSQTSGSSNQLANLETGLEAAKSALAKHDKKFSGVEDKLSQVDVESLDKVAEFLTFGQRDIAETLKKHGERLGELETLPERVKVIDKFQNTLVDNVGGVMDEFSKAAKEQGSKQAELDQRLGRLETKASEKKPDLPHPGPPAAMSSQTMDEMKHSIERDVKVKYETVTSDVEKRFENLQFQVNALESQFSQLTTTQVAEEIVKRITKLYPNSTSLGNVADIQQVASEVDRLSKRLRALDDDGRTARTPVQGAHPNKRPRTDSSSLNGHRPPGSNGR